MAILLALLPQLIQFVPVFVAAIAHIKAQTGMSTDQIFAAAGLVLDANNQKLVDDLKRLGYI